MNDASVFYHLSESRDGKAIVPAADQKERGEFAPRIPCESHGEDRIPRICVCPNVWQCAYAVPRKVELFIYQLSVIDPIRATESVADLAITDEHWITEEVLVGNQRRIPLTLVGRLQCSKDLKMWIEVWQKKKRLRGESPSDVEETTLWTINDEEWLWRATC